MSHAIAAPTDRGDAAFTIMEVLIALAVVSIAMIAIGYVMSTNARGVRVLEDHVALVETAQAVFATAIPSRKDLAPGSLSGQLRNYRWQIDIGPVDGGGGGGGGVVDHPDVAWIPELVKVRVRSPSGAAIDLETVRLMRGQKR